MQAPSTNELKFASQLSPSFVSAQLVLPTIGLSCRRLQQLNSVLLIREQREQHNQEVAFNARPFVLCGLPLRPLPKGQMIY